MASYPQYAHQLAQVLMNSVKSAEGIKSVKSRARMKSSSVDDGSQGTGLIPLLDALINAFPYYGDPAWDSAHRAALTNLLEVNLPNDKIKPHPDEKGFMYLTHYSYNGSYSGYRDAFFHGIGQTSAASKVSSLVQEVNSALGSGWWGNYSVAVLTDAIRQKIPVALDTSKLSTDLSNYNNILKPALSATYLGVFESGYQPTAAALQSILSADDGAKACTILDSAIAAGEFTANINEAISMGGDSTNAATWFLFNLWITLKALGSKNVDDAIERYKAAGLKVPVEVGPVSWWTGGYSSWYNALSGSDIVSDTITSSMPEEESTTNPSGYIPFPTKISAPNGYSLSFCKWGSLSRYKPHKSSCFGIGTNILMADGSVRPIESIRTGDEVQSTLGPRKVVLIETPGRADRILYQPNMLDIFTTSAHPFRAVKEHGPARRAVDPWALIDGIPSMTPDGVGRLSENVALEGIKDNEKVSVSVEQLTAHEPAGEKKGLVYDLLLENWEKGYPAYYVGGPDTFLAVDAETADPTHEINTTVAVVSAMEMVHSACREYLIDPASQLPDILSCLDLKDIPDLARKAARSLVGSELKRRPSIPSLDFYMRDGEWDAHASYLEYHLVRQLGRWIRSEVMTGWKTMVTGNSPGDHLAICLYDIELIGDAPIPVNTPVEIELELRGGGVQSIDPIQKISLPSNKKHVWNYRLDKVIDMGRILKDISSAALIGSIKTGQDTYGSFRAAVTPETLKGARADHFIFGSDGHIVGRICLDQRRLAKTDLIKERHYYAEWNKRHSLALAMSLGRQLGYKILAQLETSSCPKHIADDVGDAGTDTN